MTLLRKSHINKYTEHFYNFLPKKTFSSNLRKKIFVKVGNFAFFSRKTKRKFKYFAKKKSSKTLPLPSTSQWSAFFECHSCIPGYDLRTCTYNALKKFKLRKPQIANTASIPGFQTCFNIHTMNYHKKTRFQSVPIGELCLYNIHMYSVKTWFLKILSVP